MYNILTQSISIRGFRGNNREYPIRGAQIRVFETIIVSTTGLDCAVVYNLINKHTHKTHVNGKSLSWMGLTRERWCCTMGLVSRLDMNTRQTSIKTDILL